MRSVLTGFKDFIMRGNVMDLAVAVVIGTAFTALINAVVSGLFNPLIAAIFKKTDLTEVGEFEVNGSIFQPGAVLDATIKFLVIAAAVYFVIVMPLNVFAERRKKGIEPEPDSPSEDVLLLQEIRDLLAAQGASSGPGQRDARSQFDAQNSLTGRHPATGAHAALAPLDAPRPPSDRR